MEFNYTIFRNLFKGSLQCTVQQPHRVALKVRRIAYSNYKGMPYIIFHKLSSLENLDICNEYVYPFPYDSIIFSEVRTLHIKRFRKNCNSQVQNQYVLVFNGVVTSDRSMKLPSHLPMIKL